jgi:hypothetical protein
MCFWLEKILNGVGLKPTATEVMASISTRIALVLNATLKKSALHRALKIINWLTESQDPTLAYEVNFFNIGGIVANVSTEAVRDLKGYYPFHLHCK